MTKKKVILCILGLMVVFSLMTGKSDSGRNQEDYDEGVSETAGELKENAVGNGSKTETAEQAEDITESNGSKTEAAEQAEDITESKENSDQPTVAEVTTETKDKEGVSEEAVTPEFKEAMDSYEAFFDEYVEFMKKYSETDDPTEMLMDYSDYMSSYADVMQKMNEIDTENLSPADYAYYVEVTARIQKKLLEISG